ncbi:MAG TPA: twin-arginine translocase TatA/TatE family subunit [Anaerolineaceae bacterium]|jgi:sec-independent protein translocase protein TatA|nr:twin-arginine translocase TatA/TatE family subunit [Anaerolineaceae bacterium]
MHLGYLEIFVLIVLVLLLFGPGRIAKVAGELGQGIKAFKEGLSGSKSEEKSAKSEKLDNQPEDEHQSKKD